MKNNAVDYEPFEICKYCHRKCHSICALHDKKVISDGFFCDTCRKARCCSRPANHFTAKRLRHNRLSRFLEDRVYAFFKNKLPNNFDQHVVTIPTLSIKAKEVKVKPLMKARYGPQGFPDHFSCRRKAVFAFEIIDKASIHILFGFF